VPGYIFLSLFLPSLGAIVRRALLSPFFSADSDRRREDDDRSFPPPPFLRLREHPIPSSPPCRAQGKRCMLAIFPFLSFLFTSYCFLPFLEPTRFYQPCCPSLLGATKALRERRARVVFFPFFPSLCSGRRPVSYSLSP